MFSSIQGRSDCINPCTPKSNYNSCYCQPYNSYVSSDNLALDQLLIPKFIFFFMVVTYLVDIVLILLGEIRPWSLMGVEWLIP